MRALLIQKDTKLIAILPIVCLGFESFANSERYKTIKRMLIISNRLRALLIQKDTKPKLDNLLSYQSLRALLIQKDTKQLHSHQVLCIV